MELPTALKRALNDVLDGIPVERLVGVARSLSERYRAAHGAGARLATNEEQVLAYAAARMPATYAAICAALRESLAAISALGLPPLLNRPVDLLDAGAGTGAACWAADLLLDLHGVICLEREPAMRDLGARLMGDASPALQSAQWLPHDLRNGFSATDKPSPKADVVIAAYVLNEMTAEHRLGVALALWEKTDSLLLLVEPGTPVGFSNLVALGEALTEVGAFIVAPCPQTDRRSPCPNRASDWCHFSCRVARSRTHRLLKDGEAPYEDEKYAYLAFSREKPPHSLPERTRVLRHPQIRGGYVELVLCTGTGIRQMTCSKRDGDLYKRARKARAGDVLVFSREGN